MYAIKMDEKESILELTIDENLNEDELRGMLTDLKHSRRKFMNGYRLLIILPDILRAGNIDEREKIDLSVYTAKMKGLKQVVLQTSQKNSPNVERLKDIYSELSVHCIVTHSTFESQRRLGLF